MRRVGPTFACSMRCIIDTVQVTTKPGSTCADSEDGVVAKRGLVDPLAFMQIDGTPGIALKARIEQPLRVLEPRPLGEGQLDGLCRSVRRATMWEYPGSSA
jgi:hypothetical protein